MLPFDMPLRDAHDIGEQLQMRLEGLEDVERAYVHLDFEVDHGPTDEHPAQRYDSKDEESENAESDVLIPISKQFEDSSTKVKHVK